MKAFRIFLKAKFNLCMLLKLEKKPPSACDSMESCWIPKGFDRTHVLYLNSLGLFISLSETFFSLILILSKH